MKPLLLNVVLSDIHCGSKLGLMPPGFVDIGGNEIKQNPIQAFLWDAWRRAEDFIGQVADGDPYALTINGDAIEGVHHGGHQLISNQKDDHIACAEQILRPIARPAREVFMVKGTECHTTETELTLGKILGAVKDPDAHRRKAAHAFDRLQVNMHGCECAFSHHIGVSIRDYLEATQLSVVANQELAAAARNRETPPRVIGRAHRHRFGAFTNGFELVFVTPPWQAQTRHVHKVVTGVRCHPGVVILDWRDSEKGGLPRLHHKIYEAPKQTTIRV